MSGCWKQQWVHFGLLFVFSGALWTQLLDGHRYICCSPVGKMCQEMYPFIGNRKNPQHFFCSHWISPRSPISISATLLSWCLHFTHCLSPVLLPSCNCLKVLLVLHDCGIKMRLEVWPSQQLDICNGVMVKVPVPNTF